MTRGQPEGSLKELKQLLAEALRDRYTLDRVLGAGGMAIVFAARDLARERPVAIKVMRPEIADAVATTRFVREILWSWPAAASAYRPPPRLGRCRRVSLCRHAAHRGRDARQTASGGPRRSG